MGSWQLHISTSNREYQTQQRYLNITHTNILAACCGNESAVHSFTQKIWKTSRNPKMGEWWWTITSICAQFVFKQQISLLRWQPAIYDTITANKNSSGDETLTLTIWDSERELLRSAPRKLPEFAEITQNNGHYAVQGHSKSPILVRIESSYTISY